MSNDFQQNNQFNPYQSNPATFESNQPPVFNKVKVQALMGDVKQAFESSRS